MNSLMEERYQLLKELGLCSEIVAEQVWMEKYNYLKQLYETTGSCDISGSLTTPDLAR